jgi:hypothetical protein
MTIDIEMVEGNPTVEDKMMASFRIDRNDWNRFGLLAKRERLNATQVLTDYIQKCLDADRTYFDRRVSTDYSSTDNESVSINNDNVLKLIDERINTDISTFVNTALVPIQDEVKVLKEELLELKKLVNSGGVKPLEKAYLTVNEVSA